MPKKIFEIANELGKGALDLVEELKSHGFNVRNHMSSLTDEELEKAMGLVAPKTSDDGAAKKAKKKVTRKKKVTKKKVTKKKVVKKAAASTEDKAEEAPSEEKKTVTRRKSVVRRKTGDEAKEAEVKADAPSESQSEEKTTEKFVEKIDDAPKGLQVVSPAPKAEAKEEEKTDSSEESTDTKEAEGQSPEELLNTKRFGLRVVAKAEPKKEEPKSSRPQKPHEKDINDAVVDVDDDKNKKDSKKRIGGLASMISAKKANISKSQTLNEQRAENELKSYAAISGSGRPMYTQVKKKRAYTGPSKRTEITEVKDSKRVVKLHGGAYVEELAKKLKIKLKELIDKCLDLNLLIKNGDYVGMTLASKIADLYDYRVEDISFNEDEVIGKTDLDEKELEKLPSRNPIITIMGHVDHGKTTLLDYIRNAKVADGEAGGITQHIGAYSVKVNDSTLTFLDTPGHAAFGAMRQRGADVTDIVVLIVAADDGVMPQTKESIKFIQNAGKPVIVAVNKMDKEGANPDRVKQELTENGITPEDWGGDTQFCNVSALKGEGVDELLEAIALQAEILELRAQNKGQAEGVVIESRVEPGRGPLATILIQSGTLKKGDSIVVGETHGRARNLSNTLGKDIKQAGPSTPVQILGLDEAPNPGDILNVVKNEREAKKIAQNRLDERKSLQSTITTQKKVSLEDFFAAAPVEEGKKKDLNLIVRSDVQGSYEAIKSSLETLSNEEVTVKVIGGGVGPISDSDVILADSASAFLVGFNMRPSTTARRLAEEKGLDVKTYSIIYELINDVKLAIEGLLDPDVVEEFIGRAEVRDTFSVPKIGLIAGSYVIDGSIEVGCNVRLLRDGKIIFDGKMSSLKRFKDDVKEVKSGYECGVGLENYNDVKVGDLFEAYKMIEKKRTLDDVMGASNEF
ncbi:MAG: translation initiation factor IF-2 [Halobacteriovorax sp.]|nr:translation initiation factor IF-2 [Halobacteriovorax sp.]